jgi:hypothetical protein
MQLASRIEGQQESSSLSAKTLNNREMRRDEGGTKVRVPSNNDGKVSNKQDLMVSKARELMRSKKGKGVKTKDAYKVVGECGGQVANDRVAGRSSSLSLGHQNKTTANTGQKPSNQGLPHGRTTVSDGDSEKVWVESDAEEECDDGIANRIAKRLAREQEDERRLVDELDEAEKLMQQLKAEMEKKRNTVSLGQGTEVAVADNTGTVVSSVTNGMGSSKSSMSSRAGLPNTGRTIVSLITNAVNEKVYPYMKFITSEAEMEVDFEPFGKSIMDELNIDDEHRQEWWHTYKRVAKHALQQKRSSVGAALKKSVIGTSICLTCCGS